MLPSKTLAVFTSEVGGRRGHKEELWSTLKMRWTEVPQSSMKLKEEHMRRARTTKRESSLRNDFRKTSTGQLLKQPIC